MKIQHNAARILQNVINGRSLTSALASNADSQHHAIIQEICFGVMRFFERLDFILSELLEKPLKEKDADIYALLLIGLYQLEYMRVPDYAAIKETAGAAQKCRKVWAKGLINAILREYTRQKESLNERADAAFDTRYSHPDWLVKKIKSAFPKKVESILEANNQHAPMVLRVNTQKISRDDYLARLKHHEKDATTCPHSAAGLILTKPMPVTKLPGFSDGQVSVQDGAAQLAATILDCKAGNIVLDACSAPGGKTAHLLEQTPGISRLISLDQSEKRLERVNENLTRLQITADVKCNNALEVESWWDNTPFDRILLDAPCSATGVIRRHPDIKYLRQEDDIAALAQTQLALLNALWPTLRSGGKLLYATCSILPEENDEVIAQFLAQTPDASTQTLASEWGISTQHGQQILPGMADMDGFYYAALLKS